jgi:hypothetical protein
MPCALDPPRVRNGLLGTVLGRELMRSRVDSAGHFRQVDEKTPYPRKCIACLLRRMVGLSGSSMSDRFTAVVERSSELFRN